jgi:hypothetical protein
VHRSNAAQRPPENDELKAITLRPLVGNFISSLCIEVEALLGDTTAAAAVPSVVEDEDP